MTIQEIKLGEKVYYLYYFAYMPEVSEVIVNNFEYRVDKEGTTILRINGSSSQVLVNAEYFATKEEAKEAAKKILIESYEYKLQFLENQ